MNKINSHRAGLALGTFFGLVHAVWAIAVATGIAETKLSYLLNLHFLTNPFDTISFAVGDAILLIIVAIITGYIWGVVFGFIWNRFAR